MHPDHLLADPPDWAHSSHAPNDGVVVEWVLLLLPPLLLMCRSPMTVNDLQSLDSDVELERGDVERSRWDSRGLGDPCQQQLPRKVDESSGVSVCKVGAGQVCLRATATSPRLDSEPTGASKSCRCFGSSGLWSWSVSNCW